MKLAIEHLLTLAGALLTGGLLNHLFTRFWLTRKEETDVAKQLRDEMRQYITDFDGRLTKMQAELDDWRTKYFKLLEDHTALKLENMTLRAELDQINPKPVFYRDRPEPTAKALS
jgi:regulator of replication initiation timing